MLSGGAFRRRGAVLPPHRHPGAEGLKTQGGDVGGAVKFGVGRVQHLKAAVAQKAVDGVGADAAPDVVTLLENLHVAPRGRQHTRHRKPAKPAPITRTSASSLAMTSTPSLAPIGSYVTATTTVC